MPKPLLKFLYKEKFGMMLEHVIPTFSTISTNVVVGYRAMQSGFFHHELPGYSQVQLHRTIGQADTVRQMAETVDGDLLVINSDNAFEPNVLEHFVMRCRDEKANVGAVVFEADSERYGYVDDYPFFIGGAEKAPISPYALAGAFYFKHNAIISAAHRQAMLNLAPFEGELYLSHLFMYMPSPKLAHLIDYASVHEWGTPELLEKDPTVLVNWTAQREA